MVAIVTLKALTAIFLVIAIRVDGQCTLSNLEVHQYDTGRPYQGTSLFAVTIINRCTPLCDQSNVKLNCTGFKTVKPIDPSILNVSGDVCIVKNGQPITIDDPVIFHYAYDYSFNLNPISSDIHCH
ncbi:protein TAPETUM DETERMINANT 1-like [Glycine soja]|uniref:Protein TAPETUM DETERMINANT 1 n=2 Tax=Glycine soja TaxID=3848 RepID=A0A445F7Y3_GLYSO|nr:protein TAPETUM DETERMINANT 1-like [Glycine soja]RZB44935.1 hypothetical protein D0Y65_054696 [Glycine soja]